MANENKPAVEEKKGGGKKALIITFILILLGVNVFQIYLKLETDKEHTNTIVGKDAIIEKKEATLDSLHETLRLRAEEIEALGGDIAELEAAMAELEEQKIKLKRSANFAWSKVKKLEQVKSQYEQLLRLQDDELMRLRPANDSLMKELDVKNLAIVEKENEISTLSSEKDELSSQVELAQILAADKFKIAYLDKKERLKQWEKVGTPLFKAKSVVKLRVDFKLMPNKVALVENKEVYLQIKDPSGSTVYDLALGSGEFEFEGGQEYYTAKNDVLYDTKGKQVTFVYQKGSPYTAGNYKINVYCEGHLIGSGKFALK